ncbi:RNA polymerase sigma factor [Salinimicrobium sp. CAU 1759]
MSLKKLIKECKKQDLKAQEELYHLYAGRFFALCLKYSGSYEEAQDLLQDGFVKIFTGIHQFKNKGSFEGWMTRIFINTAITRTKKQHLFLAITEDHPDEVHVDYEEHLPDSDFLFEIIQELSPAYRHVFNLYVLEGHSHKEIAELLQISEGTSKSNLARARQKLKERIENHLHLLPAKTL